MGRYSSGGFRSVHGWLNPFSASMICELSNIQQRAGHRGAVGEIGVHHGKLMILLHETADAGAKSIAMDVFDDQHLNLDNSGKGDRARFTSNLQRWSDRPEDVEIVQASSLDLTPADIVGRVGHLRLASVDGGHTAECTENDLRLIEAASHPYGVIILDDVFNAQWPDVVTGLAAYCAAEDTRYRPFAISPNKVYLAHARMHDEYRQALRGRLADRFEGTQMMFGCPLDQYSLHEAQTPLKSALRKNLKKTPVWGVLKSLKARLAH